ncbi:MAG: hypothetical protein UV64_C0007G0014 [Parcubacteria group bacterium GW2011_GWC1_43_11b]|nr:MAG: hypothetical protein UV64_C0007G0014 [Parcubacteria group bacterium GW2011_GWC1_43_11b]
MSKSFLMFCPTCKKKHRMILRGCPTCSVYETPQPKSDSVANKCFANYQCDGCIAYEGHMR